MGSPVNKYPQRHLAGYDVEPADSHAREKIENQFTVRALAYAFAVLFTFDKQNPPVSLRQLSKLHIPKPTLYHGLQTLLQRGFLEQAYQQYRLGLRVISLAHHNLAGISLLNRYEVVCLVVINPIFELGLQGAVGLRYPAHATAVDKMPLTHLPAEPLVTRLSKPPLNALNGRHHHRFTAVAGVSRAGVHARLRSG